MTATEYVVLVNENDDVTGQAEKIEAHRLHLLHRAFSIFIYRRVQGKMEILLQKRAIQKYHSGGLWTNTCCSHPRPDETIEAAAIRRLFEEVGIRVSSLKTAGKFHYEAFFPNHLSENEMDYVLCGEVPKETVPVLNREEAEACEWWPLALIKETLRKHPEQFTAWFPEAFSLVLSNY